jgi:hypothetical protein
MFQKVHNEDKLCVYGQLDANVPLVVCDWNAQCVFRFNYTTSTENGLVSVTPRLDIIDGFNQTIQSCQYTFTTSSFDSVEWMFRRNRNSNKVFNQESIDVVYESEETIQDAFSIVSPVRQDTKYKKQLDESMLPGKMTPALLLPFLKQVSAPNPSTFTQGYQYSFPIGVSVSFFYDSSHGQDLNIYFDTVFNSSPNFTNMTSKRIFQHSTNGLVKYCQLENNAETTVHPSLYFVEIESLVVSGTRRIIISLYNL